MTQYPIGFGDIESLTSYRPTRTSMRSTTARATCSAPASAFNGMTGDILLGVETITHGTSGLYRLHWTGTQLQTIPVPLATNSTQPDSV